MRIFFAVMTCALVLVPAGAQERVQDRETAAAAPSGAWSRYIPSKQRKDVVKHSARAAGFGAMMSGRITAAIWLTDKTARAIVSDAIDEERIDASEAERRYQSLRVPDKYALLIYVDALKGGGLGGYTQTTAEELKGSIDDKRLFLQKEKDKKAFSRGELLPEPFTFTLNGRRVDKAYIALFPKQTESGVALLGSLDEKLELVYFFIDKEIKLKFEPKKLVPIAGEL
jgi:hypothetical protein